MTAVGGESKTGWHVHTGITIGTAGLWLLAPHRDTDPRCRLMSRRLPVEPPTEPEEAGQ